jgi:hypothetical protein
LIIDDPIILELGLTAESKKIYESRAKINVLKEGVDRLRESNQDMDPTDAANAVQVASGAASQVVHTYKGIPDGAQTIALGGDAGVGVLGGGKGK